MTACVLLTGTSNKHLAQSIANAYGAKLANAIVDSFANSEIRVKIKESVRGKHVYIIQTGSCWQGKSVNDHLIETLAMIDACKRSDAEKITVILACFPYQRQDKKDRARAPITSSLVGTLLEAAGANRIMCMDLHAEQIQGMFRIPVDNLYGEACLIPFLRSRFDVNHCVVVSPDAGGVSRATRIANTLGAPLAIMHKQRNLQGKNEVEKMVLLSNVIVKDKLVIIPDDMADTMGTMLKAVDILVNEYQAKKVIGVVTHGVLSHPALERITANKSLSALVVTNTLPIPEHPKIIVCDIGELFASAIKAIECKGSISSLFS